MDSRLNEQPFLNRLANELIGHEEETLVVLPNQRSLKVLHQLIGDKSSVQLISADDLMQELSGFEIIEPEEAIVALYSSYCRVEKNPESFIEFAKWGATFLSDINEVDLHAVDIDSLYKHISEYKEIGEDTMGLVEPGSLEKEFRSFWSRLPDYYHAFAEDMAKTNMAYRGMLYKAVSEISVSDPDKISSWIKGRKVCWIGIVPGNKSEQMLMMLLSKYGSLERYIDADHYYINNENQEAGRLFRASEEFKNPKWVVSLLEHKPYNFNVHAVSGQYAQSITAINILEGIDESQYSETAVILLDQKLLTPLRALLDLSQFEVNITTGIQLSETECYSFIFKCIQLHESKIVRGDAKYFYAKRLAELLSNPLLNQWIPAANVWRKIEKTAIERNQKYISEEQIKDAIPDDLFMHDTFELLFNWEYSFAFIVSRVNEILAKLSDVSGMDKLGIEANSIAYVQKRLKQILGQYSSVFEGNLKEIKTFLRHQIGYASLPISQNRNDCIQVIGLLESRMVDYKNVIFLGASDNHLPGEINRNTHIPFIHRKHYQLPTRYDSQALVAYHFYRLLQRCQNAHFVYNGSPQALTGGEESRFILQLKLELSKKNDKMQISEVSEALQINRNAQSTLSIKKTPDVIEAIHAFFSLRVSPSAINKYINSPLEFYYYHILKVKEEEVLEEDMLARTFGSVVHDSIEELYLPYVGKIVDPDALVEFLNRVDEIVARRFRKKFNEKDLERGKNYIQVNLASDYIKSFISYDRKEMLQNGPVKLLALEDNLRVPIKLGNITMNMFGFADRVDERNGNVRIIDYKTGQVTPTELKRSMDEIFGNSKYAKALQLAFYKWAYSTRGRIACKHIDSCIYSFRAQRMGYMYLDTKDDPENFISNFESGMHSVVNEMLNEVIPFEHREDSKYTTF